MTSNRRSSVSYKKRLCGEQPKANHDSDRIARGTAIVGPPSSVTTIHSCSCYTSASSISAQSAELVR